MPLRTDGLLYDFEDFDALETFFAPFLIYLQDSLANAKFAGFLLNGMIETVDFIKNVGARSVVHYPQHKEAIYEYISVACSLLSQAKYENSIAHKKLASLTSSW